MKVMVFGTFDLFHLGHRSFLEQAKKQGDYLVAVVGTDKNVERLKGRKPAQDQQARLKSVRPHADEAILGREDLDYMKTIDEQKPDVVCLGYDQDDLGLLGQAGDFRIVRLRPFREDKYKSSKLRPRY